MFSDVSDCSTPRTEIRLHSFWKINSLKILVKIPEMLNLWRGMYILRTLKDIQVLPTDKSSGDGYLSLLGETVVCLHLYILLTLLKIYHWVIMNGCTGYWWCHHVLVLWYDTLPWDTIVVTTIRRAMRALPCLNSTM